MTRSSIQIAKQFTTTFKFNQNQSSLSPYLNLSRHLGIKHHLAFEPQAIRQSPANQIIKMQLNFLVITLFLLGTSTALPTTIISRRGKGAAPAAGGNGVEIAGQIVGTVGSALGDSTAGGVVTAVGDGLKAGGKGGKTSTATTGAAPATGSVASAAAGKKKAN